MNFVINRYFAADEAIKKRVLIYYTQFRLSGKGTIMKKVAVLLMLIGLISTAGAVVIDDFQSYTEAGNIADDTGGIWTGIPTSTTNPDIADDGNGNQFLTHWGTGGWGNQAGAYRSMGDNAVADGEVAILDFDMMAATDAHDISFGLANGGGAGDWTDMEAYVTMKPNGDLEVRNGGSGQNVATDVIVPGTWYHFQIVADTATDTFVLYFNGEQIAENINFRNGAAVEDLNALKIIGYGGADSSDYVAVDNITLGGTTVSNDSPFNGATYISVVRTDADNDLVFTVLDPSVVIADVYFSENDPNAPDLIADDVEVGPVGHGDVTITVDLTSLSSDLSFETDYYWKVIGYEPNELDPGLIDIPVVGPTSKFTTAPEAPLVTADPPAYLAADLGEPVLEITAKGINGQLKWYKDDTAIDDLVDVYEGTAANTLRILNVQQEDEGYYKLVVSAPGLEPDESTPVRVMTHRQTSYYDFDSTTTLPDGNDIFIDSIDGYHAVLMQEAASAGLPTVTDANQLDLPVAFPGVNGYGVLLDNGDNATDPNGQYLQIDPGVCDYEDITIMLWAFPKSIAAYARLFDFGNSQQETIWVTPDIGSGYDPRFEIINGGDGQRLNPDLESNNWIGPGKWHHVAITIGGNTGRMYVDGVLRATNTGMTINPIDLATTLNYIGKSQWPDPEFNGLIDELKIFNYALSTVEIGQEYLKYANPTGAVCNYEIYDMGDYDADGDCLISLPDLAEFALRWLESDRITLP